jgi:hypothetical protein
MDLTMDKTEDTQISLSALAKAIQDNTPVNQDLLLALIRGLDEKVGLLINAQKEGVKTAMDAAEKAVAKAEGAADKRFEALNELRSMAADWRTEFARQTTVDLQVRGINEKIDALTVNVTSLMAQGVGSHNLWVYITGGILAGAALFGMLEKFIH